MFDVVTVYRHASMSGWWIQKLQEVNHRHVYKLYKNIHFFFLGAVKVISAHIYSISNTKLSNN